MSSKRYQFAHTGAFAIYSNMLPRMYEARLPQAVASCPEPLAPTQRVSDFVSRMPFIIPIRVAPSGCIGDADLYTLPARGHRCRGAVLGDVAPPWSRRRRLRDHAT